MNPAARPPRDPQRPAPAEPPAPAVPPATTDPSATADPPPARGAPAEAAPASVTWLHSVPEEVYQDWEAVYRDNISRVYRLMFAKVGNRPDAEDLTTEIFLATLRPLRLPAPAGQVRAYLLATARTALARYWSRRLGQQVTALTEDVQEVFYPGPHLESLAPQRAQRILSELPDRYKRILERTASSRCTPRTGPEHQAERRA